MYAQSDVQRNRQFYLGDKLPYDDFDAVLEPVAAQVHQEREDADDDPRRRRRSARAEPADRSSCTWRSSSSACRPSSSCIRAITHGIPDPRNQLVKSVSEMAWMDYYVRGTGKKFAWRRAEDARGQAASRRRRPRQPGTREGLGKWRTGTGDAGIGLNRSPMPMRFVTTLEEGGQQHVAQTPCGRQLVARPLSRRQRRSPTTLPEAVILVVPESRGVEIELKVHWRLRCACASLQGKDRAATRARSRPYLLCRLRRSTGAGRRRPCARTLVSCRPTVFRRGGTRARTSRWVSSPRWSHLTQDASAASRTRLASDRINP